MREEKYQKIGKEVGAVLESYDEGDMKLEEVCLGSFFERLLFWAIIF